MHIQNTLYIFATLGATIDADILAPMYIMPLSTLMLYTRATGIGARFDTLEITHVRAITDF